MRKTKSEPSIPLALGKRSASKALLAQPSPSPTSHALDREQPVQFGFNGNITGGCSRPVGFPAGITSQMITVVCKANVSFTRHGGFWLPVRGFSKLERVGTALKLKTFLIIALTFIKIAGLECLAADGSGISRADDMGHGLKDCFLAVNKECGTSIMPMGMADSLYQQTLAHHFSLVIPDYGMYMSDLQPQPGKWSFEKLDRIVAFAKTNPLKIRGHVLVYDYPTRRHGEKWAPTPKWVYQGHYSKAEMIRIMYEHIETVMKRYQDSIAQWIVVNEAVGNGLWEMEDNIWLRTIGKEYVDLAFARAHQIAPNAELIINDYGADYLGQKSCGPFKANRFYRYVRQLRQKGVPLNGVGLQFHLTVGVDRLEVASIENNFARYRALGLKVYVTELDVKIKQPVTENELCEQAALYAMVVNTALNSTNCSGLSVWGYTDKYSWITTFHAFPGDTDACLFDADLKPKKACVSILESFNKSPHANCLRNENPKIEMRGGEAATIAAQPGGAANRSQPVQPGTNSTLVPTGSGR